MKFNRFGVTLGVVAVAAFVAGRADLSFSNDAAAQEHPGDHPRAQDHPGAQNQGEMSGQMQEWMQRMHEAGEPGEHHDVLNKLVGEWEGTYTWTMAPGIPPMEMQGTATREWVLNGRYLKETVKSSFQGEEFMGIGFIGYNNTTGEYEFVWMDSHSTGIYTETGSFDPTTETLMTWSRHMNPMTGKMMHTSGRVDLSNNNRQTMTGYGTGPDGQWFTMFEGTMHRVK